MEFDDIKKQTEDLFPNTKYWSWREEPKGQQGPRSLVLEFDAKAFELDVDNRFQHEVFFQTMTLCSQVALVITNLVDLDEKLWTAESVVKHLQNPSSYDPSFSQTHHKCFKYQKITSEEHQETGFPYEYKHQVTMKLTDLMKDYQTCDGGGGSDANDGGAQRDSFHYIKDLSFHEHLPDLCRLFKQNCRVPEILPCGAWCLLNPVRG